jgi:ribosomal protein S19
VIVDGGSVSAKNIQVLGHPEAKIVFANNVLTVSGLAVGKYTLRVRTTPDENHYAVDKDLSITVNKATAVIKASSVTVALKKGSLWTIKLADSKTGNPISNMMLTLKVFTGKNYKIVTVTTNFKGEASYQTKGLTKGIHRVIVSGSHAGYNFNTLTSTIKVIKPKKLTFKVNKNIAKDGSSLSITTLYKKKPINGVKLTLVVYNGKKVFKTVSLKSKTIGKYKGVSGWGTNKITVGSHKIVLMPANIKYAGSKNIKLTLKKSAKKYVAWETII